MAPPRKSTLRPPNSSAPDDALKIEAKPWPDFEEWFQEACQPGQHAAFVAPTGYGKTTFWVPLLKRRKYVLAMDPKGGDSTLAKAKLPRISQWPPPRKVRKQIEEGKPARFVLGEIVQEVADFRKMRAFFHTVLEDVFATGSWTIYIDELQLACDRRMMALAPDVETLLIAARDKGVSVWSSFQRPWNVPTTASDQSTLFIVGRTRDRRVIERVAEMGGRPIAEIDMMLRNMESHTVAVFSTDPFAPVITTRPRPLP